MGDIFERFTEASSYAGLAAVAYGVGQFFGVEKAITVSDAINAGGQIAVETGDPVQGVIASVLGAIALLRRG